MQQCVKKVQKSQKIPLLKKLQLSPTFPKTFVDSKPARQYPVRVKSLDFLVLSDPCPPPGFPPGHEIPSLFPPPVPQWFKSPLTRIASTAYRGQQFYYVVRSAFV
jgi:hypothetical protein